MNYETLRRLAASARSRRILRRSLSDIARDDGELETLVANGALTTNRLGGAGRGTPLWKEEIRVGTPAVGKVVPRQVFCVQHLEQSGEQRTSPYMFVITSM